MRTIVLSLHVGIIPCNLSGIKHHSSRKTIGGGNERSKNMYVIPTSMHGITKTVRNLNSDIKEDNLRQSCLICLSNIDF